MRWSGSICVLSALSCGVSVAQTPGFSVGGHTKYRFTSTTFPADSLFRDLAGSSAEDVGLDGRLNLGWRAAGWEVLAHAQFGAFDGDTVAFTRGFGDEHRRCCRACRAMSSAGWTSPTS